MPLSDLDLNDAREPTHLGPLSGMPLKRLRLGVSKLRDLTPLRGLKIEHLDFGFSQNVSGADFLKPLAGMPLKSFAMWEGSLESNIDFLRGTQLKDLTLALRPNLKDLHLLEGMPIESLRFESVGCSDISALATMPLTSVYFSYCPITNLNALANKKLTFLHLSDLPITDISVVRGMPLQVLTLQDCKRVRDFAPLANFTGYVLHLNGCTNLTTLSSLQSLRSLVTLTLHDCTNLKDLSPLEAAKELKWLTIPTSAQNIDFLRDLPKLERLGYKPEADGMTISTVTDFWKAYDARKGKKK